MKSIEKAKETFNNKNQDYESKTMAIEKNIKAQL